MSETVHYKGYLDVIPLIEGCLQKTCKKIVEDYGFNIPEGYGTPSQYLMDNFVDEYYISPIGNLYKVEITHTDLDEEDIYDVEDSPIHGRLNYRLKYYNGGQGQDEALDTAFENYQEY